MVTKHSKEGYVLAAEGILRKTTVYGEKTLLCSFLLSRGAEIPVHHHPYEQTGFMISGRMIFRIDGKETTVEPGDSWSIPSDAPHGAQVLEDSEVIEVFSPAREDYLPEDRKKL
ncbi:MAG: cupin domain-containing protein [Spirochaetales bacterium]|nr:cupin domain-containing protein [Spirochaetales bacterium]